MLPQILLNASASFQQVPLLLGDMMGLSKFLFGAAAVGAVAAQDLASCPGYKASNVQHTGRGLTADLTLAGDACNAYGTDLTDLTLTVEHQTNERLHVIIQDAAQQVYQVPEDVLPRPGNGKFDNGDCDLAFKFEENPFSFSVVRRSSGEVLFDSSAASLVFEDQYLRLRTALPEGPSLYGLGEHTDPFMLNTTNYTRTIWNRDAYGVSPGTNLYVHL
jgi:alpha-glucosidase